MNATVKTPTRTAFQIIPYREMTAIDCDSLDFAPCEPVEKPDAMERRCEQLAMLNLLDASFSNFGKSADAFVDFDSNIRRDPNDLRRRVSQTCT